MLLLVTSQIHAYCISDYSAVTVSLDIINFLIVQGAYVYARNNKGKSVRDYLTNFIANHKHDKKAQETFEKLKNKVPSLQTLAAVKEKGLKSVYDIPDPVRKFLEMH